MGRRLQRRRGPRFGGRRRGVRERWVPPGRRAGQPRDARRGACRRGSPSHERRASSEGRPRAHPPRRDPTRSPRRVRLSRTGARRVPPPRDRSPVAHVAPRGRSMCRSSARDGTDASRVTMRAARRAPTSLTTRAPSDASTFVAEKNARVFVRFRRRNDASVVWYNNAPSSSTIRRGYRTISSPPGRPPSAPPRASATVSCPAWATSRSASLA